jgi:hypothetical protein
MYLEINGGKHRITLEDMGRSGRLGLELVVTYDADSGEPATWDYPGSAASVDIYEVHVLSFYDGTNEVPRERADWFEWLDAVALEHMLANDLRKWEDEILDDLNEEWADRERP